ncbi:MAG: hypothetical protein A4E34_02206 [Methanoregula sp. PtaU1.Bin006]|uniref:hypothetical protein n=1 Tax=Methanoregula sp. PtaU1.Bin006 TaxID=1811681 RepID=UPI0009CE107F|nr:hypothetical protein [Methanoregula sp. PtaU1.Bin006]OPY32829.1 MAG: hypothetical protein A4E34_02206 [Methanoregula sp. PtaU1.Bin006]
MNDPGMEEQIFETAIRMQLCGKKTLEMTFSPRRIRVLLPPKRMLASESQVPVSKVTAFLAEMEQKNLIHAEQRGGMWSTEKGNRIIAGLLATKYRKEAAEVLGETVLRDLLKRL